jgi:2,4-dienoyl-CoA reductase-like NADH-dependent reductase (Old Yellow Enzyme family)
MIHKGVLLQSIVVREKRFSNRYVSAPLDMQLASDDGLVTEALLDLYRKRKGPSLVICEHHRVLQSGKWNTKQLAADRDECIPGMRQLAQAIHENGQIAVVQINHSGSAVDTQITGMEAVAPSAVVHPVLNRSLPRALEMDEIAQMKKAFADAAVRVKQAGFDGVEIHGAHGYLLTQFLSPLTNKRTDEYGGTLENRSRLHREIVKEVRSAVGNDFLVLFRLGADDYLSGGTTVEDACRLAPQLQEAGVDILDITSGLKGSRAFSGQGFFRDMIKQVKAKVTIPVIAVGGLEDPGVAAAVIAENEADFVALGRALVKQPDYIAQVLQEISATTRHGNPVSP